MSDLLDITKMPYHIIKKVIVKQDRVILEFKTGNSLQATPSNKAGLRELLKDMKQNNVPIEKQ